MIREIIELMAATLIGVLIGIAWILGLGAIGFGCAAVLLAGAVQGGEG